MPLLARAKQRLGRDLDLAATAREGAQNMLCAYLAAGVLTGLALNSAFGLWWADPMVALGIAGLAIREGLETWHGDGCCTQPPGFDPAAGAAPPSTACEAQPWFRAGPNLSPVAAPRP